jgi:hypothetical protein
MIAAQVDMIAPSSRGRQLDDTAAPRPAAGTVLYGGPHVNEVARDSRPACRSSSRRLAAGEVFEGDAIRLIAAVPPGDAKRHAGLVIYAGTGTPGVTEINAVRHGGDPILVADAFGRLVSGRWVMKDGRLSAELGERARRIAWRRAARARRAGRRRGYASTSEMLPHRTGRRR